ncbi:MAG TPA: hypothetical protein VM842_03765 [Nitrospira sp.]|jgi:hypothetical protein|nr:hypothetical protein [Nitrospira sp.]
MSTTTVIGPLIVLLGTGVIWASSALSETTDTGKTGSNQGLTIEKIGQGIKSAAKNIEEEIPKIGPAISDTFKKATSNDKEKDHPKSSPQTSGTSKK